MSLKLWLAAAAMAMIACPASAKDGELSIDFSLRTRLEAIGGQFRPSIAPSDTPFLMRATLEAEYDAGPIRIGGEVIDSRVYFARARSSISATDVNALEPAQVYFKTDLDDRVQTQIGRFTINLGSRRLISRSGFRNNTTSFTGARLDLKSNAGDSATLFWTMPQTRLPEDQDGIRIPRAELDRERIGVQLFGGSVTSRVIGRTTIEVYLYRLNERDGPDNLTRDRRLWVPGIRVLRPSAPGHTDFEIEAIYQGGTVRASALESDNTDLPVSALGLHGHVGWTFATSWSPRIAAAIDYGSGDSPGGRYTRFDTLFGARGFEFGPTSFYGAVNRQNLVSVEARAEVTPNPRWDGYFTVRPLWLANARDSFAATGVIDQTGKAGRYAGTQIDSRARYWVVPKQARLSMGYVHLFKGGFLTQAANAPRTGDTTYGYVEMMLIL